jgi:hypothetical protein
VNIGDVQFEMLEPDRLMTGRGGVNTTHVTGMDMISLAAWALAVGRQLLAAELEAAKKLTVSHVAE